MDGRRGAALYNSASFELGNPINGPTWVNSSAATTYTWSPAIGLNTTSGTSVTANPPATTTYTVTATDLKGATSTSNITVIVDASCTGRESTTAMAQGSNVDEWAAAKIYPNPASGSFIIELSNVKEHKGTVQLVDMYGRKVKEIALTQRETEIPVKELPIGPYVVTIVWEDGSISQKLHIIR